MKDKLNNMVVNSADKNYSNFKTAAEEVVQQKLEDIIDTVVKEKSKSIFEKN